MGSDDDNDGKIDDVMDNIFHSNDKAMDYANLGGGPRSGEAQVDSRAHSMKTAKQVTDSENEDNGRGSPQKGKVKQNVPQIGALGAFAAMTGGFMGGVSSTGSAQKDPKGPPRSRPVELPKNERMCVVRDTYSALCHSVDDGGEDVRIARVLDAKHADSVHSGDSSAELNVVSIEVEHLGAAEDGHVLELSLSDGGAIVADDDKLGLSVSEHLHNGLETNFVLARFDGERQLLVGILRGLSLLSHCAVFSLTTFNNPM